MREVLHGKDESTLLRESSAETHKNEKRNIYATEPVAAEWCENCGQNTRVISMRKICASCDKPNARTYDLHVVIPGNKKIARKWYRDLLNQRALSRAIFLCVFLCSAKC